MSRVHFRDVLLCPREVEGVFVNGEMILRRPKPSDSITFHTHPLATGLCRPSLQDLVRVCVNGYRHHFIFCGTRWVWELYAPTSLRISVAELTRIKQKRNWMALLRKKGLEIHRFSLQSILQ